MGGFETILDAIGTAANALRMYPGLEIATLVLGGIFIWSGAAKLRSPRHTVQAIADSELLRAPNRWPLSANVTRDAHDQGITEPRGHEWST